MSRPLAIVLLAAAGCGAPALELTVDLPAGFTADELTLSATIYAPGTSAEVDCDAIAFGKISRDELATSLVESTELDAGAGAIGQVPRVGRKLILVEGRDGRKQTVVAGCTEIATISRPARVHLDLEIAVAVEATEVDKRLAVELDYGSAQPVAPPVELTAYDAKGRAVPNAALRAQVIGPSGRTVDTEPLTANATGTASHTVLAHFAGPFAVDYTARWALKRKPTRVTGLAVPANRKVRPFGDSANVLWVLPVRVWPDRAGFLALIADSAQPPNYSIATAVARSIDGNQVRFEPLGTVSLPGQGLAAVPAGSTFAFDPGTGRTLGLLLQRVNPTTGTEAPFLKNFSVVTTGATPVQYQFNLAGPPSKEPLAMVVPVGDCDEDREQIPLLIAADLPTAEATSTVLSYVAGFGVAPVTAVSSHFPRTSHCVVEANTATVHRLLFSRDLAAGSVRGAARVVDLGDGLRPGELPAIGSSNSQLLPLLQTSTTMPGDDGLPRLLTASHAGFSLLLEVMRVATKPGVVLERESLLTSTVPAAVFALGSGSLVEPGSRDLIALVDVGSSDDVYAPVNFSILTATAADDSEPLLGEIPLPCLQRRHSTLGATCRVLLADLDRDKKDEILLASYLLDARDPSALTEIETSVVRFGEW